MTHSNLAEAIEKQNREVEEKANEIKQRPDCQDKSNDTIILCSMFDKLLERFSPIVCFKNVKEAEAQYKNIVDHSNSMISHYPENYEAWVVGEFDLVTAELKTDVCYQLFNLKQLQSEEANSYYNVLNSVNASLNTMDAKLNQFARLDKEIENKLDLASKRMARIDALMDNNVDLFPIPLDTKKVAKQLNTTVSAITGKEENKNFFSKILK